MLGLSRKLRVFAYGAPCDMRKSFNTLAALVLEMGQDVVAGDAFLFIANAVKLLDTPSGKSDHPHGT